MYKYHYTLSSPLVTLRTMSATHATRTLEATSTLPEFAQLAIYEFAFGSRDLRRHKFRLARALKEMTFRLSNKIALADNVNDLHNFLITLWETDVIRTFDCAQIDPEQVADDHTYLPIFPSTETNMAFVIIWSEPIVGPPIIIVRPDTTYGSVFMVPNYFRSEGVTHAHDRTDRTHVTLQIHPTFYELAL